MSEPSLLNAEQQRAVEHGDGPLMVLAGAGSGKTRVLVQRIARLVERGADPREVLAVTFTNKAAGEMRERLRGLLHGRADAMWIGTFHATCARLLRIYGERVGLSRDFTIFDDDDQIRLVSSILKELGVAEQVTPRSVLSRIDRAKNAGAEPGEHTGRTYVDDLVRRVYPAYRDRLAREDAVDFNDILLKVLELAADRELGDKLAGRFRHVLVDEFQDTNLVQYRLVRHFSGATRNLTVVGDDDQSIYGWRGAEPRNLLDFGRDFPDATIVKLEQNYRSTKVILEAANSVIVRNPDRHAKALWTERPGGEPILWEEALDERAEAEFVARAIVALRIDEGRHPGDIAVLYRTHAQSRSLEEALRAHRIDYRLVGGTSFFQRREVKDLRAYLKLIVNPAADSAFERIVNVPARGIGVTTVDRVKAHARLAGMGLLDAARSCSYGAVASLGAAARGKLASFVEIADGLREVHAGGAAVAEIVIQAIERSGYRGWLEREGTQESRERLDNLSELVAMAAAYDEDMQGRGTLLEFDERISLSSAMDEADGRGRVVTLMTIHAAKGLEFPVVFLCGMEDGLFPSLREREPWELGGARDSLEEERRLAYVAITRARDRLILTSARTRRIWNEVRVNQVSRFLDEIPPECIVVRARPSRPAAIDAGPRLPRPSNGHRDELDQRVDYDDMPAYDMDDTLDGESGVGAGARVRHASFGTGKVLASRGSGKDRKLTIEFPVVGVKTILARFVQLA